MRALRADRVAVNPIPWATWKAADDPTPGTPWRFADPAFRLEYPGILAAIRAAGFPAVMVEVLPDQPVEDHVRMLAEADLRPAPGYASVDIPFDLAHRSLGATERARLLDPVRRKAEEAVAFGLDTIFLAPGMSWEAGNTRTVERAAVGADADPGRLAAVIDLLGEAADVLAAEGVRAGLHSHVGTWIETADEIEATLAAIAPERLGASFDIGHLAWAGIDPGAMIARHAGRLIDLHLKDLDLAVAEASRRDPAPYDDAGDAGLFREPGRGDLDLDAALAALPEDWSGWVIVEVDRSSMAPAASVAESWAWVSARLDRAEPA